jgi:hypothetical protein
MILVVRKREGICHQAEIKPLASNFGDLQAFTAHSEYMSEYTDAPYESVHSSFSEHHTGMKFLLHDGVMFDSVGILEELKHT